MNEERTYVAIDLKSFYASVECVERQREPLTTNLVVADESRTEKTICLAVSPSLKSYGISGRARLFEVVQQVRQINTQRLAERKGTPFEGESDDNEKIKNDPSLKLEYIVAPPRMALYIQYSTRIYQVYLKHVAPEDIHVYSIDEVFIDVTRYLPVYGLTARELTKKYLCITLGKPKPTEGKLELFLRKDEGKKLVEAFDRPVAEAKTAITLYKTRQSRGPLSLVEVELLTGRTHQIRASFAHVGCPLLGDGKYGRGDTNRRYGETRQALYSYYLRFDLPTDAGILDYLRGREFTVDDVPFVAQYFGEE